MVSVEAMAAGVLPICNDHSGLSEVLEAVRDVAPHLESKMRLPIRPGGSRGTADGAFLLEQLPDKVEVARQFMYPNGIKNQEQRKEISARLRQVAVDNFSWCELCKKISDLKEAK